MAQQHNADVAIIGGGPAGLNAALILGRSCKKVIVVDVGQPRNRRAELAYGFLTRDATPPHSLRTIARQQLVPYDVSFITAKAEHVLQAGENFDIALSTGELVTCRRLILATGVTDDMPALKGMKDFWGKSVFSCPYCDGWEVRQGRIGILGTGSKAYEFALLLENWCRQVTIFLNGEEAPSKEQRAYLAELKIEIVPGPISALEGENGQLRRVGLEDGTAVECNALFYHSEPTQADPLALQLGCRLTEERSQIAVDAKGRTSVRGVYAAGDRVTAQNLLITAAASGAVAGFAINEDLCEEKHSRGTKRS